MWIFGAECQKIVSASLHNNGFLIDLWRDVRIGRFQLNLIMRGN